MRRDGMRYTLTTIILNYYSWLSFLNGEEWMWIFSYTYIINKFMINDY